MLTAASILLIPTAALVAVLRQWRLCLYSLSVMFVLVGFIEAAAIQPWVGISKLIAGGTAVSILFLAAREAFTETHVAEIHSHLPTWEYLFESVVAAIAAVGALLFARAHPLFGLMAPVSFAWVWLGLVGLFMTILATNILEVGVGLLVFFTGLDILVFATLLSSWWAALMIVELLPIALAFFIGILSMKLSRLGHSLRLDVLKEKAPFVVGLSGPVRIRIRRGRTERSREEPGPP